MSLPWMPLWIPDYLADTLHLTAKQHGAYLLLLMHYWMHDGQLPKDDRALANIAKLTPHEWKSNRATLAAFFDGDFAAHKRADHERSEALEKLEKNSSNAKKAASARWGKSRNADAYAGAYADALPAQCPPQPQQDIPSFGFPDGKPTDGGNPRSNGQITPEKAQPTPEKQLFDRGREVLGKNSGGLIKKILEAKGKNISLARAVIETAATKADPREYVSACIRGRQPADGSQVGWDPGL